LIRFVRHLFSVPSNIEAIAKNGVRIQDMTNSLQEMHGELRAMRQDLTDLMFEDSGYTRDMLQRQSEQILRQLEKMDLHTKHLQNLSEITIEQLHPMAKEELLRLTEIMQNLSRQEVLSSNIKNNTDDLHKTGFRMAAEKELKKILAEDPRSDDSKFLCNYEYQMYSQNGEDGIIDEIFKRIGTGSKTFLECGVSDGLECNTTALLLKGWSGRWVETDTEFTSRIKTTFASMLRDKRLTLIEEFLTAENIDDALRRSGVSENIDLLSVDIDGNDYWIWKALSVIKPRAVVIEYNALHRPPISWVMKYAPDYRWDGSNYYGASLEALAALGQEKGYTLVACELTGNNAFFVRSDLASDKFMSPFDAKTHYQPPRYYLVHTSGHKRGFGPFLTPPTVVSSAAQSVKDRMLRVPHAAPEVRASVHHRADDTQSASR
jgi:hypothetical protein